MQLLKSQNNYDNFVYDSYYDFIRSKNFKDRNYNFITTIKINNNLIPDIINVCNCFNQIEFNKKNLFIICDLKFFEIYDKYEYKIDYLTVKKCVDLNLNSCKYMKDLNTTRFKKSQLIKYPTTKDIIDYNYGEDISKYYISDKNFIIMINKKGAIKNE